MSLISRHYIYVLRDPRDKQARYVGATRDFAKRMADHLKMDRGTDHPVKVWIAKLAEMGLLPLSEFVEVVEESKREEAELRWICKFISEGAPLLNVVKASRAYPTRNRLTISGRERIAEANRKRWALKSKAEQDAHMLKVIGKYVAGVRLRKETHLRQIAEEFQSCP